MRLKHRSLLGITLLTLITFGIYPIYWFFITKTEMNVLNGKSVKVPFFLFYFIPIINIWWFWRFAKAIEKTTKGNVGKWSAFLVPPILEALAGAIIYFVITNSNGIGFITLSNGVYALVVVVLGLLPIYYFQSNLNRYAK
jgi:hypothetical protein